MKLKQISLYYIVISNHCTAIIVYYVPWVVVKQRVAIIIKAYTEAKLV